MSESRYSDWIQPRGIALAVIRPVMNIIDIPLRALQKVAGQTGMASFFLLPNIAPRTFHHGGFPAEAHQPD
jgi:hypothetical protein